MKYMVYMGLSVTVIEDAGSTEQARALALEKAGLSKKPWLAREWRVHPATEEELRLYAAHADGYRPSQPTAKTAPQPGKKPRKTAQQRLLL